MKKKSGFKKPLWLCFRYTCVKIWYFFHRLKRKQYAYIMDGNYNAYYQEDRFFRCHYVEYDRRTGVITYSEPYRASFEPYKERYCKLEACYSVLQKHLKDFENATGIPSCKYTMDYGSKRYLEYLKEECPDAVFAKKFEKRKI